MSHRRKKITTYTWQTASAKRRAAGYRASRLKRTTKVRRVANPKRRMKRHSPFEWIGDMTSAALRFLRGGGR